MSNSSDPPPNVQRLFELYEKMLNGDEEARARLADWFETSCLAMKRGPLARKEMETLSSMIAAKRAERSLGPRGRFRDLQHDPWSVVAIHFQRFQNFIDDIEEGQKKVVEQYFSWVEKLTEFVLLDLVKKAKTAPDQQPLGDEIPQPTIDQAPHEQKKAKFAKISKILDPGLFSLLILKHYGEFTTKELAEILERSPEEVENDIRRALAKISRNMS